jgi:XTP/dITP diphosphohydrolase
MKDVPDDNRGCYYNCTVAIYVPQTKFVETVDGQWHGRIAHSSRGEKSFGYAPIFLAEEFGYQKTNAEVDHEELISINHRGKAFNKAINCLKKYIFEMND